MSKWSSRICSGNLLLVLMLLARARGQEKNGEFKHDLPEGVELVDPKSLGLTDVDLSKFLGNVKVLGGGQVGDTKTQILTVGFEGDENINFNDFTIPGLTDGNKTALPEKDKEIADMAFQKFKEFFQDPQKAKQFEERQKNSNIAFQKDAEPPKHRSLPQQNNIHAQHSPPQQFRIPMIQKPYTTPRPHFLQVTTHHPHRIQQPPPPPPPPRQFNGPNPNAPQPQNQQQQQQIFNSQIKSQPPLEFGARIPVSPNTQARPPLQHQQQYHNHQQSQGEFQHHRQQEQKQHHRLTIQHQQHGQNFQRPPPPQNVNPNPAPTQHHSPQHQRPPPPPPPQNGNPTPSLHQLPPPPPPPNPNQHHFQHQRPTSQASVQVPQNHRFRFPADNSAPPQPQFPPRVHAPQTPQPQFPPRAHPPQQSSPNPPTGSHTVQPRPPLVQSFVIHPRPQHFIPNNHIQHQPSESQEQGRIVRNQLLQLDRNTPEPEYKGPSKGLTPPPPPHSYQSSATNQIAVHSLAPHHQHLQNPTEVGSAATSSIYIHHGPKPSNIEQTPFHPQFQPPTRFAKDFTPIPYQSTTTNRPISFEVTPSMALIPLSTNENAITDPTRTMQLRWYQQQKAQASMLQAQTVLPTQAAPTTPTTTPISITTSFPETNDPNFFVSSSTQYDFPGSQQSEQQQSFENNNNIIANQIHDNAPFTLQTQQQQHQLHYLQHQSTHQPQQQQFQQLQSSSQPTLFYSQEHRRPPRQGPPRFQFHVSHELGKGPRFQMNPDPKSLFNSIRRKRGYRRLSNLFNRMFGRDRH